MNLWMSFGSAAVSMFVSLAAVAPPELPAAPAEDASVPEVEPAAEEPAEAEETPSLGMGDALMQEAYDRFLDGNARFRDRRYLAAAADYERSYAAVPSGHALYNLSLAYEKGGDYVRALDACLRYVELPDCSGEEMLCANKREEVKQTITTLRTKVGTLSIVVDDGVKLQGIEIDERILPPEDFPLVLVPGNYELRVRGLRRGEVRTREVEVAAGQITSLLITGFNVPDPAVASDVVRREEPRGVTPRRIDEEERRRRLRLAFYTGVGFTVASGVATAVVGGLAWKAHNEWDARCKGEGVDCTGTTSPLDARRQVEQLRPATNALVGVTAGLGITTVVLGLFAFSGRKGPGARASVTRVEPTAGGVRVRF